MSDALKLALRISAIDLFSGVLRHFRDEVAGTGAAAKAMQRDYDSMVRHTQTGLKALAVASYGVEKLEPAINVSGNFEQKLLAIQSILQGAHPDAKKLADEMARIRDNALKVSVDLKFPAQDVLDAQLQMIQAGVPLEATLDRIDKTGHVHHGATYMAELLAETRGLPVGLTAQNIAKFAHSFGVDDNHYGEMIDSIAKAMNLGSADPTELFYNLNQSGAVLHYQGHMDVQQAAVLAQALAPLGGESAAAAKGLVEALTGAQVRGYKWQQKTGFDFFDKQGNFIGLDASLDRIHEKIKGMTEKDQDFILGRDFGASALPALRLLMAVGKPGIKSYPEMEHDYWKQAGLVAQNEVVSKGYNFQAEKLDSEKDNIYTVLFKPLTDALAWAVHGVNDFAGSLINFSVNHPALAKAVSGTAAVAGTAAAGYGIYNLIRAAGSGSKLLKNFLTGTGSVATGVAEGKAIEKFTGMAPVFVTNWPANGFGGLDVLGEKAATESVVTKEAQTAAGAEAAEGVLGSRAATVIEGGGALMLALGLSDAVKTIVKPMRADYDARMKRWTAEDDENERKRLGLSSAQYAMWNQLETKDMPYGKWEKAHPAQHWWTDDTDAYDTAMVKLARQRVPDAAAPVTVVAKVAQPSHEPALAPDFWKMVNGAYVAGAAAKPAPPTKLEGDIRIRIDQDNRVRVTQVKTNQPNVHVDVGTMLGVP